MEFRTENFLPTLKCVGRKKELPASETMRLEVTWKICRILKVTGSRQYQLKYLDETSFAVYHKCSRITLKLSAYYYINGNRYSSPVKFQRIITCAILKEGKKKRQEKQKTNSTDRFVYLKTSLLKTVPGYVEGGRIQGNEA